MTDRAPTPLACSIVQANCRDCDCGPSATSATRSRGGPQRGWRAARAPLVAFTDDDCVADRRVAAGRASTPSYGARRLRSSRAGRLPNPTELQHGGRALAHGARRRARTAYETCNMLYPRAAARSLGGFDETFGPRSRGRGHRSWPGARSNRGSGPCSRPMPSSGTPSSGRGSAGMLRVAVALAARDADLRRASGDALDALSRRVLERLALPVVALAAGAGRAARGYGGCCSLHLRELRRRARRADAGIWAVAFLLLYDAVECLAVLTGAVRSGTLVL